MSVAGESFDVAARERRIRECMARVDQWDFEGLRGLFADDVVVRLSDGGETHGLAAFIEQASRSREYVAAIRHTVVAIHHSRDGRVATAECDVDYTRLDGVTIPVPGVAIYGFGADDLVTAYRVYANTAMVGRA